MRPEFEAWFDPVALWAGGAWKDSDVPSFAILTCAAGEANRQFGRGTGPVALDDEAAQHA